jgi:hypothetical protein
MKPSRIDGLALCTILAVMGCALGCVPPVDADNMGSSSSAGSSSAGSSSSSGGDICIDGGAGFPIDVDIIFPDCTPPNPALILQGTIDGKPFNQSYMYSGAWLQNGNSPPELQLEFGYEGDYPRYFSRLDLYWREPTYPIRHSVLIPVSVGTLSLQEDTLDRAINPGSTVRIRCDEKLFQFNLIMDSGQLVGCARRHRS